MSIDFSTLYTILKHTSLTLMLSRRIYQKIFPLVHAYICALVLPVHRFSLDIPALIPSLSIITNILTLDIHDRIENISIGQLKVAYLDTDLIHSSPLLVTPEPSPSNGSVPFEPIRTRSGRKVHCPDRREY